MKVLQVNCVWRRGSTGKIMADLHDGLAAQNISSVVCYGRGPRVDEPFVYKTCSELGAKASNLFSRFSGLMYGGAPLATRRLISVIKRERPDVVHLHCLNGYFVNIYRLIAWLRDSGIRTVLTLHAEFMHTANCGYSLSCDRWLTGCGKCPRLRQETRSLLFDRTARSFAKMKAAFCGFDDRLTVVSVSPWLMERAARSPILAGKRHVFIPNGIDTDAFAPCDTAALRARYAPNGERIYFFATSYFSTDPAHIKGGAHILALAERLAGQPVRILVAGPVAPGVTVPENITLLGPLGGREELARHYAAADVTLLVSLKETFSMICAESLSCGTPIAGFMAGGPEGISLPAYSRFVPYGDVGALAAAAEELAAWGKPADGHAALVAEAKAAYSHKTMLSRYMELYDA